MSTLGTLNPSIFYHHRWSPQFHASHQNQGCARTKVWTVGWGVYIYLSMQQVKRWMDGDQVLEAR